ncbi:hypothetical protein G6F22_019480 [Rhizopus arrhizus]|nr:hypothetical protein G6F22_019480 [Rhizopus arrhizus]
MARINDVRRARWKRLFVPRPGHDARNSVVVDFKPGQGRRDRPRTVDQRSVGDVVRHECLPPRDASGLVLPRLAFKEPDQDRVEVIGPLVVGRMRRAGQQRQSAARQQIARGDTDGRRHHLVLFSPDQ